MRLLDRIRTRRRLTHGPGEPWRYVEAESGEVTHEDTLAACLLRVSRDNPPGYSVIPDSPDCFCVRDPSGRLLGWMLRREP